MELFLLMTFIPACFALNMIPGPNNLLSMSNAQRFGFKYAVGAGLGRLAAFVLMIILAASGLATILYTSEKLFFVIKILGALYLFWVAYKLWNSDVLEIREIAKENKTLYQLMSQEFFLAIGNPKAILIFIAFFPQFIDASKSAGFQFFILGSIFLCLELLAISIYASFGVYLRQWFSKPNMRKIFNRTCATFIGAIGISMITENQN